MKLTNAPFYLKKVFFVILENKPVHSSLFPCIITRSPYHCVRREYNVQVTSIACFTSQHENTVVVNVFTNRNYISDYNEFSCAIVKCDKKNIVSIEAKKHTNTGL